MPSRRTVRVVPQLAAMTEAALAELRAELQPDRAGLISFATGATFAPFFAALAQQRDRLGRRLATHLDEYVGFGAGDRGGMLHELFDGCPWLRDEHAAGRFWPVPSDGAPAALAAHEQRIAAAGGIALQFLGLGRNGHVGFNEPGTPFESGFHVAELTASTRADAAARFAPAEPPAQAVTAGPATILGSRRAVLLAAGSAKAAAVRAMLEGPVTTSCPASILQRHPDLLVLLDPQAASLLGAGANR
jgi:glucosamine-6-phosphate deaminase